MSGELPTVTVIHFKGQTVPFEQIYITNFKRLLVKARSLLNDKAKAEDAVQELFVQLWERKSIEITGSSIEAYLMMSIHHRCCNLINKEQRDSKKMRQYAYSLLSQEPDFPTFLSHSPLDDNLRILELVKQKLSNNQQKVIRKCYEEDKTHKEAAAEMNIKPNTLKSHLERSFEKFKSFFQQKCATSF